jgi:phosphatidylglycerol:prolipoprotein diacylglycerol transferase
VRFPDGPRFDLGLLELLFTLFISALFLALDQRPRPTGFFIALFFALYGPVRFALDVLRIGDTRYFGWTPGQYVSIAAALFGAWLSRAISKRARRAYA